MTRSRQTFSMIAVRPCIVLVVAGIVLTGCQSNKKTEKDFIDQLLDLSTGTSSLEYDPGQYVQLTNLYDTLAHDLPEDNRERLILVERLKDRGFEITGHGRGNYPPLGPRIVIIEMTNGDCVCDVSKIYYATVTEDSWQMAEGINCKRKR